MNCKDCKIEMEEGVIDRGIWVKRVGFTKLTQKLGTTFNLKVFESKVVIAYRCPQCGKIELFSEQKK